MYGIKINNESVQNVENTEPRIFKSVKMFAGDSWHEPLNGKIRKIKVETKLIIQEKY